MPLADLLSDVLTPDSIASFAFAHARDHDEIDQALKAKGITSPVLPLDPIPTDPASGYTWLMRHQVKHNAMNNGLGLTGVNLTQFDLSNTSDFQSFVGTNFGEHQNARSVLGI